MFRALPPLVFSALRLIGLGVVGAEGVDAHEDTSPPCCPLLLVTIFSGSRKLPLLAACLPVLLQWLLLLVVPLLVLVLVLVVAVLLLVLKWADCDSLIESSGVSTSIGCGLMSSPSAVCALCGVVAAGLTAAAAAAGCNGKVRLSFLLAAV